MPDQFVQVLRESEARFRSIIEQNADAILIVRTDGAIRYANPAAEGLLGADESGLVGQVFGIPLNPNDTAEVDLPQSDGALRIAEMRVADIPWEGEPAYLACLRDVTERRRADEAVRFQAEASRELAGSLDLPATIEKVARLAVGHLADWCTIDLIEPGSRIRRVAVQHAIDDFQPQCVPLHGAWSGLENAEEEGLARVLQTGEAELHRHLTPRLRRSFVADDRHVPLIEALGCRSAMLVPLVARGQTLGAISFFAASPCRYGLSELALARDLAQRAGLALDNARLYDSAQEAVRRRDEFLAMLAHELRNPLAAIQSATEVLHRTREPVSQRQACEAIDRQSRHMARLLDDLLDMSRVMHGKIELKREFTDVRLVLQRAIEAARAAIEARQHRLTVDLPGQPAGVHADPIRLEQVFVNLLHNASKYTDCGGAISVAAQVEDGSTTIRVRDTGMGISPDDLPHVFDLFVQADPTLARSSGGLGIGLTLVRQLVERHDGSVSAHSDGRGRGSEFVVRLPLAHAPVADPPQQRKPAVAPMRRRVVVVEDNADCRSMLEMLLALEGHDVLCAHDGHAGVEAIASTKPDVALIDVGLPGLDGYQVAACVRNAANGRSVYLVAVTGYGQADDAARAAAAGFDRHLVKPVRWSELSQILAELPPGEVPPSG